MELFNAKMARNVLWERDDDVLVVPEGIEGLAHDFQDVFDMGDSYCKIVLPKTFCQTTGIFVSGYSWPERDIDKFTEIEVDPENPYCTSVDGVLFSKDMKTLVCFPCGKEISTYVVPEGVEVIADCAFADNIWLKKIVLPKSLKKLGMEVFDQCDKLAVLNLPEGLEEIGETCFGLSFEINRMHIPESLKTLKSSVFTDQAVVIVPDSITNLEEDMIWTECVSGSFEGPAIVTQNNKVLRDFAEKHDFDHFEGWREDENGIIWSADGKTLISFPVEWPEEDYQLPDQVRAVYRGAFTGTGIKSFSSSHTVEIVGGYISAFGPPSGKKFAVNGYIEELRNT